MKILPSTHRRRALTLIEVLMVLAALMVLAIFVLPALAPSHGCSSSPRIQCVNNLKQTGLACYVWAGDNDGKYPMEVPHTNGGSMEFISGPNEFRYFQVMSNELSTPKVLICPADLRSAATNFVFMGNSNLSFFVNLDVNKTNTQDLWSGDRNITNGAPVKNGILQLTPNQLAGWTAELHKKVGNILLADGSVAQVSTVGLQSAVANTSMATNRLQMPVLTP